VLNSSLGYTEFDNLKQNHSYADMNGRTTLVSKAAAWASQKGIICTISAGNEGTNAWKYISAPADADSILAVGAVDRSGLRASFSSMGPSFDKRIKPDVAAMGVGTVVGTTTGTIATSNGTSFSAPLMAGFAAGMVQANQRNTSWQIMDAIRKSGHQSAKPDQLLGYGIPNFLKATTFLNPILGIEPPKSVAIQLYPNPVKIGEKINIKLPEAMEMKLEIFNSQGIILSILNLKQIHQEIFLPPLSSGKYYFRFTGANSSQIIPVLYNF
jgi:subtilisin family serine protease